jgi:hypothetical protein
MGQHVRQADERGVTLRVIGVMALDRRGDRLGQVPATGEHAADQCMVDAQLAALVVQALLGGASGSVDLLRVARVGVHQDELADVVQQGGDEQAVAVGVAGGRGEAVGGALDGDGVQAEALGRGVPRLAALEELERLGVGGEPLDGLGREHLDGGDDRFDLPALGRVHAVGEAHDGDDERDVRFDRADHVAGRRALLGDQRQEPVTRLGERGKDFQGLEGRREPFTVALVAGPADDGVRRVSTRPGPYCGGDGCGAHKRVIGRGKWFWSLARGHV